MEQLSLLDNFQQNTEQQNYDVFGCCSHYRECSDARQCVMDIEGYEGCSYRSNLEKGNIFYGKNANGFDKALYNRMCNDYETLDSNCKTLLNSLIIYFMNTGMSNITWLHSSEIDKLHSSGWLLVTTAENILEKFDFRYLTNQIKLKEPELKLPRKKEDLLQYIKDNKVHCIYEAYINKYRNLSMPSNRKQYYIELYYDYIQKNNNEIVDLSFKATQTEGLINE